ncbi:DUF4169 domain-containing protein [Pelagivirga sediminicola]|uniref:DUF4169 domain-containing protein n=1 Tax=Pelagivirga sediminicola TaxID=2170575 RepID=A0A2T7G474_9RHOB|nr:DUF4169 family protein [Pelagivirga sediminicola]PVA09231.1 DUF4169 domain-containing protein [Pelagivirga sediminicola]
MSDAPINLNRARKARARAKGKALADENAVRFGRTKAQKTLERSTAQKSAQKLDNHKREP